MKALGRIQLNHLLVPKEIIESQDGLHRAWWKDETHQEYVEMRISEETQKTFYLEEAESGAGCGERQCRLHNRWISMPMLD